MAGTPSRSKPRPTARPTARKKARKDARVDEYIQAAEPFARPILRRLRRDVMAASGELREDIKWGSPHFVRRGIVAGMAGFQTHVGFGFWRSKDMQDPEQLFDGEAKASMCHMKLRSLEDVPDADVLARYVAQAIELDETFASRGTKGGRAAAAPDLEARAVPPDDLLAAMRATPKALRTFEAFPPGKRRDYVEWITEAKRAATRERRIGQAVEWLAEGKSRHWKYESC